MSIAVTFDVHAKKQIWVNIWAGVFRAHTYKINEEGSRCKILTSDFQPEI